MRQPFIKVEHAYLPKEHNPSSPVADARRMPDSRIHQGLPSSGPLLANPHVACSCIPRHRGIPRIYDAVNPEIVKAGARTLSMLRLTIADLGRQALAG
jgi:hypothetical protein